MEKLGKAAQEAIETIPAPIPSVQKESEGIGIVGNGIAIIVQALLVFVLYKNYTTNKK